MLGAIVRVPIGSGSSLLGQITKIENRQYFVEYGDFHHTACPGPVWLTRRQFQTIRLSTPVKERDREWDDYPPGTEVMTGGGTFVFRRGEGCWIRDVRASHPRQPDPNVTSIRIPV